MAVEHGLCWTWSEAQIVGFLMRRLTYEGHSDPRSNANPCVIYFTIAIFQDSLHQSIDALLIFPDPITIFYDSHSNPRCLATREYKIRPWPRLKLILLM